MLNENHKVDHPAVITRQPEGVEPTANITHPMVDIAGKPLLPRIVERLRQEMDFAATQAPAGENPTLAHRPRSVIDAGEAFPAIDHAKLGAYEAYGRKLHNQAASDALIAGWRWLKAALKREAAPPVVGARARSVLDAGETFPAIDHAKLSAFEKEGRRQQAIQTGEVLGKAARWIVDGLTSVFAEPAKPVVMRTGATYWRDRARFHGAGF